MKKNKKNGNLLLVTLILIVVFYVGSQMFGNFDYREMKTFDQGWTYEEKAITLPLQQKRQAGDHYAIQNKLPVFVQQNNAVCFKSENIFWKVYVDDKLVASYTKNDLKIGHTPGDRWNLVMLPTNSSGKNITIDMQILYTPGSNYIQHVYYGNYAQTFSAVFGHFLPGLLVCVLIFVLSIVYIVLNETFLCKLRGDRTITLLGLFGACAAMWSASQSPVMSMITNNCYVVKCTTYLTLPYMLGFIALFYISFTKRETTGWMKGIMAVPFIYGVLVIVLDITGIWAFPKSVLLTQAAIVFMLLVVIVCSVINLRNYKKMAHRDRMVFSGNLMTAIMGMIDVYRCYALGVDDYSKNTRIAFLAYMIILGIDLIKESVKYLHMIEESTAMKKLAYVDGLTGVGNRMAFNKAMDELPLEKNVGFVHFDINNLKQANDVYGHMEGDKLIHFAAKVISESYKDIGNCYRYGGDEFTVICEDYRSDEICSAYQDLLRQAEIINKTAGLHVKLSVAYGYAHYNKAEDENIMQTFNRADENMYRKKKFMKNAVNE